MFCRHPEMTQIRKRRLVSVGVGLLISIGSIFTLIAIISPNDLRSSFSAFNPLYIAPFVLTVVLMVVCFGYRWRFLLELELAPGQVVRLNREVEVP